MGTYSISDLAELTGVKTHTLRIWEKRYGILRPHRTSTNIRYYLDSDLNTLRMVQRLNTHGVRISRIADMSPEEMETECKRISLQLDDYDARLEQGLVELDVTMMESALDEAIRHHGFESTLLNLILPFMRKIEVLWVSGKIDEANEACFKELVKRKTSREIDLMPHNCSGPRVLMLLPKGNRQESDHLFLHYFLRKQGLCVTDIGCDINLDCALSAMKNCASECVIIVNSDPVHWQFGNFIKELSKKTILPIIVSGRASEDHIQTGQENVILLEGLSETIQFAHSLRENLQNHISNHIS